MTAPAAKNEAERRSATVMFADIVGFTAMSEKMDPEDLTHLMNSCFSMMETVIDRFGGVVDKFIGDCVMALFGVPFAAENAAQRAVNAAIELKKRLASFNDDHGLEAPLGLHVGINTGVVVAGDMGGSIKRDYTVMGETVNIASRLESASAEGQILVGPDTYSSTRHLFRFRELKRLPIKGKKTLLRVYELLSIQKSLHRTAFGKRQRLSSQLVGRDSELAFMENRLGRLLEGKGGIINLVGEAGVGKTRIVLELKNNAILKKFRLIEGRATSIGENLRYHVFVDLLRHLFGINEQETDPSSVRRVIKEIRSLLGQEDAEEAIAFIALVMGLSVSGSHCQQVAEIEGEAIEVLIKKTVRQLLTVMSEKRPLLVILEDIHWADKSSINLLESLLDLSATRPVFFLNMFRPHYSGFCDNLANKGDLLWPGVCSRVKLKPLTEDASKTLIRNLLSTDHLPAHVKEKIVSAGSGNPLFIEEVLKSLIDSAKIKRKNHAFLFEDGANRVSIPPKISDVLMERIDMLDKPTRNVVRTASVIGKRFYVSILKDVSGKGDDIHKSLKKLVACHFLTKKIKKDGEEYSFNHELVREAAYKSILRQTKKEIHLKIAKAIESVFHERLHEFYGMLSYHYGRAGAQELAETYMLKAGEDALKTGASNEAIYYYKKALAIYLEKYGRAADPGKIATLEKNIAFSLFSKGRHTEAAEYYRKVVSYHGLALPENRAFFITGFFFCFLNFALHLYVPLLNTARTASKTEAAQLELFYKRLISLSNVAPKQFFMEVFYFSKRLLTFDLASLKGGAGMAAGISIALSWASVSYALSRRAFFHAARNIRPGDGRSLLYVEVADLIYSYYTGAWEKKYDETIVEQGLRLGEIMYVATYISFQGRIMIEQGRYKKAKKKVSRLAHIGTSFSHDFARALKYYLNTSLLLKYRKLHAALIEAQEGIAFMLKKDFSQLLVVQYSSLAKIHALLKDNGAAKKSIMEASLICSKRPLLPPYLGNYLLGKSFCELSELEDRVLKGNRITKPESNLPLLLKKMLKRTRPIACDRTEAFRLMGCYYDLIGKKRKALAWYRRGVREGNALGARPELARLYMHLGLFQLKHNIDRKDKVTTNACIDKALLLFNEMNLEWDLDQIERKMDLLKCGPNDG